MLPFFAGCSETLHSAIELIPIVPPQKPEEPAEVKPLDSVVYVDVFLDARPAKSVVVIEGEGREVPASNDVVEVVVQGLQKALQKKGYQFADTAPIILSGEIRQWSSRVTGSFSKRVESNAELYVEVRDPADRRVYSGVYRGFAARETAGMSEDDVQQVLRLSMTEAISQVTGDEQLMKLLSSF